MDRMDDYAEPIARGIEAKSEGWFARQGRGIAEGFAQVGRDAVRDVGNSYQAIHTQDAGWHAQWNARDPMHGIAAPEPQGDTTVYVGLVQTSATNVYVGLSDDIAQQQEAADIERSRQATIDKDQEPDFRA